MIRVVAKEWNRGGGGGRGRGGSTAAIARHFLYLDMFSYSEMHLGLAGDLAH